MTAYSGGRAQRRPLFAAAGGKLGLVGVLGMLLSILALPAGALDGVIDDAVDDVIGHIPGTVVQIDGGDWHTCALTAEGDVYCWGHNNFGQIGDGTGERRHIPVRVAEGEGLTAGSATQISAGSTFNCALTDTGDAYCWGRGTDGQLGDGKAVGSRTPVKVIEGEGLGTVAQISAGGTHTCAVDDDGDAYCWGGRDFTGPNQGQLGNGTTDRSPVPVKVLEGEGLTAGSVAQINAGWDHTCAADDDGDAYCWGHNWDGKLGDGNAGFRLISTTPVRVVNVGAGSAAGAVTQIDAGKSHTCARTGGGDAYCWGRNSSGQLGDGTTGGSPVPVQVVEGDGLTPGSVAQITTGIGAHSCAITTGGDAFCWGGNDRGQVGDATTDDRNAPTQVGAGLIPLTGTVAGIGAGGSHSCAATVHGQAYCWGQNGQGQLGDSTEMDRSVPGPVLLLPV